MDLVRTLMVRPRTSSLSRRLDRHHAVATVVDLDDPQGRSAWIHDEAAVRLPERGRIGMELEVKNPSIAATDCTEGTGHLFLISV